MRTSPALLASGLIAALAAAPTAVGQTAISIRAEIDGRSRLILDADTAQWFHLDYAAPGRHRCVVGDPIEPTIFDGVEWFPEWPDVPDCENRDCDCFSDVFVGLPNPLPDDSFGVRLELIDCRGTCEIIEVPTASNGYRVVIEFDDNPIVGQAFYEVLLIAEPCAWFEYCEAVPNSTGEPGSIAVGGSLSVSADDTWLEADGCPPGEFGLFLYGQGATKLPLGDGYLCVDPFHPGLFRLEPVVQLDGDGRAVLPLAFDSLPAQGQITPGTSWNFQVWFRDSAAGKTGSNLTTAAHATFCP